MVTPYLIAAYHWLVAHALDIALVLAAINRITRRIPKERMASIEKNWPRVANALRFVRAFGPDDEKALRAVFLMVTGRPWPVPATVPDPVPVVVESKENESSK